MSFAQYGVDSASKSFNAVESKEGDNTLIIGLIYVGVINSIIVACVLLCLLLKCIEQCQDRRRASLNIPNNDLEHGPAEQHVEQVIDEKNEANTSRRGFFLVHGLKWILSGTIAHIPRIFTRPSQSHVLEVREQQHQLINV